MTNQADATTSEKKIRSKRRNRCIRPVAMVAVCMLALNAGIALLLMQWIAPTTVTFDMKGTVDAFMDQTAKKSLSEKQSALLAGRFTESLESSLGEYQRKHRAVILVVPSVVAGAEDITDTIQRDIAVRMAGGHQ
ncbi:type-F conjugative transfer system protein TrbI [Yersinia ruckeri]|uniref:type-F conjugative transfer system protein TrbI n=1 Tax=Yersinia ruckeri TaxID=29486 RepID=UPI0009B8876C|nr:type-F conjugative transfer system protein TrbI [Yersinia ruckeri]AUQ43901.1 type-F conjugative transfer system protein TrbI [Yersinia ruckeri]WMS07322.1 type-F conjugative transfer system protein TrbI [Yersinia ruckeri]